MSSKKEIRGCSDKGPCSFKSYFGNRCIAPKRVIWRTCRHKIKPINKGQGNVEDRSDDDNTD